MDIQELARLRAQRDELKAEKDRMYAAFSESDEWKTISRQFEELAQKTAAAEEETRGQYVAAFDGNKHPHPAITLKEFDATEINYSEQNATQWCVTNFTPALKLDRKLFEKAAKDGSIPAAIVTVTPKTEIRAQIASDLSEYL